MKQAQGMVTEMFQLQAIHGQLAGMKQMDAELDKGDEQQKVERRNHVGADQ